MRFTFHVSVEVNRQQGKFASREDIATELQQALDDANPGDLQVGDDGEYTVDDWTVDEQPQEKPKRKPKAVKTALDPEDRVSA